jgi:nicotinamide riboside transporter PnuC
MKLTAPTTVSWLIAVIVGVLGILLHQHYVHFQIGIEAFWLVAAAFVLLAVASLFRGM